MKKVILIIVVLLIFAMTTVYLLNIKFDSNTSPKQGNDSYDDLIEVNAANPIQIDGDWSLVWSDDFIGQTLNTEKFTKVYSINNYNNEAQCYLPDNTCVKDGCLCLTAKKEDKFGKSYTSGMISTEGKLLFTYGKIEARIKFPEGTGLMPAFRLLSESSGNEVDVFEETEPNVIYGSNHYFVDNTPKSTSGSIENNTPGEFHTYSMEWDQAEIKWFLDGKLFHETTTGIPDDSMYITLSLAVGGDWGNPDSNTVFPASMSVDTIKLYKH